MSDLPGPEPSVEQQKSQQQRPVSLTTPSSLAEFIVDDLKLFVRPLTAVYAEFRRQLKR